MIQDLPQTSRSRPERHYRDPGLLHVAIIMDGNGRWARQRGLTRPHGHRAGARRVREIVETAADRGVGTMTLYAFSCDNWSRPAAEVQGLMRLFRRYLAEESARCRANDIRLSVIGRRDRLPRDVVEAVSSAERLTASCKAFHLRIALDYSSRDTIVRAAAAAASPGRFDADSFSRWLADACSGGPAAPDVDLLIRTGGEQRLSDFLLWECAYAELYFTRVQWPDFDADALTLALDEFRSRERRFGRVSEPAEAAPATANSIRSA